MWGSGLISDHYAHRIKKYNIKYDIRCLRGPETRKLLIPIYGDTLPEKYGDPAVLMPMIYSGNAGKKIYPISLIAHYDSKYYNVSDVAKRGIHCIDVLTTDYKNFIDEILKSELVISSSLHGIILAESYGIPVVPMIDYQSTDRLKYDDWYGSTKRNVKMYAASLDEAIKRKESPVSAPLNIEELQCNLLETFPYDLYAGGMEK